MVVNWEEIGAVTALISLVGASVGALIGYTIRFAIRVIRVFEGMQTSLKQIATNDLPHIYGEIRDLRKEFIDYIKEDKRHG